MKNYKALVAVPVGNEVVHVAFKLPQFRSPVISDDIVDVVQLISEEKEALNAIISELKSEEPNPIEIGKLYEGVKLPEFMSSYVESRQTTNSIFDILPEGEFEEATIEESKVDLKTENERLAARNAELEELLNNSEKEEVVKDPEKTK